MSSPNPFASIIELFGRQLANSRSIPGSRSDLPFLSAVGGVSPQGLPLPLVQAVLGGGVPETLPAAYARPLNRPPDPGRVFDRRGILPQMAAQDTALARRMYEAIYPRSYGAQQGPNQYQTQNRAVRAARALSGMENSPRRYETAPREDAWRMYLGLPQRSNTFKVSDFKPSRSSDRNAIYFSLNVPPADFLRQTWNLSDLSAAEGVEFRAGTNPAMIKRLVKVLEEEGGKIVLDDVAGMVMGNFTIAKGADENGPYISYYDKWDLDPPSKLGNRVSDSIGKAFELYDRVYYDPETFEPIQPPRRRTGGR